MTQTHVQTPRQPRRLSERVFSLQQVVPFSLLVVVMFYEVTRHLLLSDAPHPALFAFEFIMFGLAGPAALWLILQWIGSEIRARERAEDQADTRTRMLLEMQHRIRNNLQTVADLLSLELSRASHPDAAQSLRDSVARIKTIAAAHDLLSTDQVNAIDAVQLARRIAENALQTQARPDAQLALRVEGEPQRLPSKAATAFALVVNELVSNALEHGLAARHSGELAITIEQDAGQVHVVVQDSGAGLSAGFDAERDAGLGLRIVRTLVEKDLRGHFALSATNGTRAEFSFPLVSS